MVVQPVQEDRAEASTTGISSRPTPFTIPSVRCNPPHLSRRGADASFRLSHARNDDALMVDQSAASRNRQETILIGCKVDRHG